MTFVHDREAVHLKKIFKCWFEVCYYNFFLDTLLNYVKVIFKPLNRMSLLKSCWERARSEDTRRPWPPAEGQRRRRKTSFAASPSAASRRSQPANRRAKIQRSTSSAEALIKLKFIWIKSHSNINWIVNLNWSEYLERMTVFKPQSLWINVDYESFIKPSSSDNFPITSW